MRHGLECEPRSEGGQMEKRFSRHQLLDRLYDPWPDMQSDGFSMEALEVYVKEGVPFEHAVAVRGIWDRRYGWYWFWGKLHDEAAHELNWIIHARFRNQIRIAPVIEFRGRFHAEAILDLLKDGVIQPDDHLNIEWDTGRAWSPRDALEQVGWEFQNLDPGE